MSEIANALIERSDKVCLYLPVNRKIDGTLTDW
jgi:hypothetical protein